MSTLLVGRQHYRMLSKQMSQRETIIYFLKRVCVFLAGVPVMFAVVHLVTNVLIRSSLSEETVYFWGDSQLHYGLDLAAFTQASGLATASMAESGSSIYDFLSFADHVPAGSRVVTALPKLMLVRNRTRDRNEAGVSWYASTVLLKNGYSLTDLTEIWGNNILPKPLFSSTNPSLPETDTALAFPDIVLLSEEFNADPERLAERKHAFMSGLRHLQEKGCSITLVLFPFHPVAARIEGASSLFPYTSSLAVEAAKLTKAPITDTIILSSSINMMYDYTHLNARAARQVGREVAQVVITTETAALCFIKWP